MRKIWDEDAWSDYLYWQTQDKKTLKKINNLLKDIDRNGYTGIGKPEPLRNDKSGFWSRRIDEYNRLVYRIKDNVIEIASCKEAVRNFFCKLSFYDRMIFFQGRAFKSCPNCNIS